MKNLLLCVGLFLCSIGFISSVLADPAASNSSKSSPQKIETERKFQSIVFDKWRPPEEHVRGDLSRDIAEIEKRSKALDPAHAGVTLRLQPPDLDYLHLVPKRNPVTHRQTSNLENIPLADVLGYLIQLEDLNYKVNSDGTVLIWRPVDSNPPLH